MENIINKAIEGGWKRFDREDWAMTPAFWQALSKACGWVDKDYPNGSMQCESDRCDDIYCGYGGYKNPIEVAKTFYEINLTQGFNEAVEWLEEQLK